MRSPLQITAISFFVLLLYACSGIRNTFSRKEKIYQPPRIGAEHRFEDGLRRQKNPDYLFSKKERKEMEKMGMTSGRTEGERSAPNTRISPLQADTILYGIQRDTSSVAKDSSKVVPADSTVTRPADTSAAN